VEKFSSDLHLEIHIKCMIIILLSIVAVLEII